MLLLSPYLPYKTMRYSYWAIDFIKTSSDNCSPTNQLKYTFNEEKPIPEKLMEVHYFKGNGLLGSEYEFSIGKAQRWNPNFRSSEKVFSNLFPSCCKANLLKQPSGMKLFNSTTGNTQPHLSIKIQTRATLSTFHVTTVKGRVLPNSNKTGLVYLNSHAFYRRPHPYRQCASIWYWNMCQC